MEPYLTTGDIAAICKVNISTVARWIKKGMLPAAQVGPGGHHRVEYAVFEEFCAKNRIILPEPKPDSGQLQALVVDDELGISELLEIRLQQMGFTVTLAENGFQAGLLAKSICPDLITLDLLMPGMNGLEALKLLREEPNLQKVKILVVSGMGEEMLQEALKAGANGVLRKPFDTCQLRSAVAEVLPELNISVH